MHQLIPPCCCSISSCHLIYGVFVSFPFSMEQEARAPPLPVNFSPSPPPLRYLVMTALFRLPGFPPLVLLIPYLHVDFRGALHYKLGACAHLSIMVEAAWLEKNQGPEDHYLYLGHIIIFIPTYLMFLIQLIIVHGSRWNLLPPGTLKRRARTVK